MVLGQVYLDIIAKIDPVSLLFLFDMAPGKHQAKTEEVHRGDCLLVS
jgi:hypothetical protein